MRLFTLFISIALIPTPAFAKINITTRNTASTEECYVHQSQVKALYCIDRGSEANVSAANGSTEQPDVIYHFHGSGGSERLWFDKFFYTAQIRSYWQQMKVAKPTVVSVSIDFTELIPQLGQRWLLVPSDEKSPLSGLLPFFKFELMPEIESRLGYKPKTRTVFGESMGGYNATQVALNSSALFDKVAIICAPLAESVDHFSTAEEVLNYSKSTLAWGYYESRNSSLVTESLTNAFQIARAFMSTKEFAARANPLSQAKTTITALLPKLYVTAGAHDSYLSYEGSERLVEILKSRGVTDIEWRPLWGGHCVVDVPSLAQFLVE